MYYLRVLRSGVIDNGNIAIYQKVVTSRDVTRAINHVIQQITSGEQAILLNKIRLYSVVVITFGFDPDNPGSNPGTTFFIFVPISTSRVTPHLNNMKSSDVSIHCRLFLKSRRLYR